MRRCIALATMAGLVVALVPVFLFPGATAARTEEIPHPNEYFGRRVGGRGVLIPHREILEYYELLAERSERVRIRHVGQTTLGRPFYYALVSSPANLSRLDHLIANNQKLYDPSGVSEQEARGLVRNGVVFVVVNHQIHSTEVGASQGGILLAHRLAAAVDSEVMKILDNVVVVHVPVHNPDGQEMVYEWLERWRGTEFENSDPPFLYQKYAGHDNNRDWYMFTQAETRLSIVEMQNVFRPQFTLDQHQQGPNRSRIFVPPFEDPWEPNVDPALIASNNMIGTYIGQYLTVRGFSGVEWKQRYDAWSPARAYYHTHGGVRILTEVASADFADPIEIETSNLDPIYRQRHWFFPDPWPGGSWGLRQIVDYHYHAAMGALGAAADLREALLTGMYAAQRRSVEPPAGAPYAFLFPVPQTDAVVSAKLLEVLELGDVRLHRARSAFHADGLRYEAGTTVVLLAQPAGRFAKTILERQEYPRLLQYEGGPLDPPYDVTAHTLPLLMNVRVETAMQPFDAQLVGLDEVVPPPGRIAPSRAGPTVAYLLDPRVNNSYSAAVKLAGRGLSRSLQGFEAERRTWPAGTWMLHAPRSSSEAIDFQRRLDELMRELHLEAVGVSELPDVGVAWVGEPRAAIYQSFIPSMPEGWLRFLLDDYQIPYALLHNNDLQRGDLGFYSTIFLPPGTATGIFHGRATEDQDGGNGRRTPPAFAGGIGESGVRELMDYVEDGGKVVTWGASTDFVTQYLGVEAVDLTADLPATEFNIPGSLLRIQVQTDHPLAYGLQPETAIMFRNDPVWSADPRVADVVGRYSTSDLLLSGWMQGERYLARQGQCRHGRFFSRISRPSASNVEDSAQRDFSSTIRRLNVRERQHQAIGNRPEVSRVCSSANSRSTNEWNAIPVSA